MSLGSNRPSNPLVREGHAGSWHELAAPETERPWNDLQLLALRLERLKADGFEPKTEVDFQIKGTLHFLGTLLATPSDADLPEALTLPYLIEMARALAEVSTGHIFTPTPEKWGEELVQKIAETQQKTHRIVASMKSGVPAAISEAIDAALAEHPVIAWLKDPQAPWNLPPETIGYPPLGPYHEWQSLAGGENPLARLFLLNGLAENFFVIRPSEVLFQVYCTLGEASVKIADDRQILRAAHSVYHQLFNHHGYYPPIDRATFQETLDGGLSSALGPQITSHVLDYIDRIITQSSNATPATVPKEPSPESSDTAGNTNPAGTFGVALSQVSEIISSEFRDLVGPSELGSRIAAWSEIKTVLISRHLMESDGRLLTEEELISKVAREKLEGALSLILANPQSLKPFKDFVEVLPSITAISTVLGRQADSCALLNDPKTLENMAHQEISKLAALRRAEKQSPFPGSGVNFEAGASRAKQFVDHYARLCLVRLGQRYRETALDYQGVTFQALETLTGFPFPSYVDRPWARAVRKEVGELNSTLGKELSIWLSAEKGICYRDDEAGRAKARAGIAAGDTWGQLEISFAAMNPLAKFRPMLTRLTREQVARLAGILPEFILADARTEDIPIDLGQQGGFKALVRLSCGPTGEGPIEDWSSLSRAMEKSIAEALRIFLVDGEATEYAPVAPPVPRAVQVALDWIAKARNSFTDQTHSSGEPSPAPLQQVLKKILTPTFEVKVSITELPSDVP